MKGSWTHHPPSGHSDPVSPATPLSCPAPASLPPPSFLLCRLQQWKAHPLTFRLVSVDQETGRVPVTPGAWLISNNCNVAV